MLGSAGNAEGLASWRVGLRIARFHFSDEVDASEDHNSNGEGSSPCQPVHNLGGSYN